MSQWQKKKKKEGKKKEKKQPPDVAANEQRVGWDKKCVCVWECVCL